MEIIRGLSECGTGTVIVEYTAACGTVCILCADLVAILGR
jgi:hypothetical protein